MEYDEEELDNVFARGKQHTKQPFSNTLRHPRGHDRKHSLPYHTLPKILFPKFDVTNPKIWFDDCLNYFTIYGVSDDLKVTAATMHLEGNARKWWQAHKQNHLVSSWKKFCEIIQSKFGADDFRTAINELLALKQTRTIEEYTTAFQALQYDITMHNSHYDDIFFASTYVAGLKDDIKAVVEPHVPVTVDRAVIIAKIQQRTLERNKSRFTRSYAPTKQV